MTPERVLEAYSTYNRAMYKDHKISRGCTKHRDSLPGWVLEGRKIYHREYHRRHRQAGANPRIDAINLLQGSVPRQDFTRVLSWAETERRRHGGARKPGTSMLLPDDGFIDPVAVELAVSGKRAVRMTHAERIEAVRRLMGGSLTFTEIGERIGVSMSHAKRLSVAAR